MMSSKYTKAASRTTKRNRKGKLTTWDANSQDGKTLTFLVAQKLVDGLAAKPVREQYPQFKKYAYSTFSSALLNARRKSYDNTEIPASANLVNKVEGLQAFFSTGPEKNGVDKSRDKQPLTTKSTARRTRRAANRRASQPITRCSNHIISRRTSQVINRRASQISMRRRASQTTTIKFRRA